MRQFFPQYSERTSHLAPDNNNGALLDGGVGALSDFFQEKASSANSPRLATSYF
jgi:hypothetical protein